MERFCKDLKDHAKKNKINYENKEMILKNDEEKKSYEKKNIYCICKKTFSNDDDNKKYHKVRDPCHYTRKYRGATHSICNLRYKTPKEIHVVFNDGSTNHSHCIIKELVKEFEDQFEWLVENPEK